ncbi:MAG TPA: hypothetical protein VD965_01245, partial [Burkholderiales bacterium]|nr:hypothetical protein [Burkholderiales bacterium]
DVHRRFAHSDKIRLFQMIAKNVGVRRSRGRFVLATNIDILFSDGAMHFMRERMRPGRMYLADRADIPAAVPDGQDFSRVLDFCERETFRVNTGAFVLNRGAGGWRLRDRLKAALPTPVGYGLQVLENRGDVGGVGVRGTLLRFRLPFTNSCGDFTAMAREDWDRLRAYPEWPVFSYHLDSILVHQAFGCGMPVRRLGPRARVFHIDHGGGYTREGAGSMFQRLQASGTPFIGDAELTRIVYGEIKVHRGTPEPVTFNPPDWGMEGIYLKETNP